MWRSHEITHQKHLTQSGRSLGAVRGVQWTFSIHSAYYLKSQSENKKLSWSVWIEIIYKYFSLLSLTYISWYLRNLQEQDGDIKNWRAKLNCDSIVNNWDPYTQMINLRKFRIIKLSEEI